MKKLIVILILSVSITNVLIAQNWQVFDSIKKGYAITEDQYSNYVVTGISVNNTSFTKKYDVLGNLQWTYPEGGIDVITTYDNGFAFISNFYNYYSKIVKLNNDGSLKWSNIYNDLGVTKINKLINTSDYGILAVGNYKWGSTIYNTAPIVFKVDSFGNKFWSVKDTQCMYLHGTAWDAEEIDSNYYIAGVCPSTSQLSLSKIGYFGDLQWTRFYSRFQNTDQHADTLSMAKTHDGMFIVADGSGVVKFNLNGDTVWKKIIDNNFKSRDIQLDFDNNFVLCGKLNNINALVKIDQNGDLIAMTMLDNPNLAPGIYNSLKPTLDQAYVLTGYYVDSGYHLRVTKTGAIHNIGYIMGNVYHDFNQNCIKDSSDDYKYNMFVKLTPGNQLALTDQNGNYTLYSVPGNYTVEVIAPDQYYNSVCPPNYSYNISLNYDDTVANLNFAIYPENLCPRLTVDIASLIHRRCNATKYYINYSNTGIEDAFNAYVDIEFDPFVSITYSSIPWTAVNGNVYTFDLGIIPFNSQGSFYVYGVVSCSAVVNQTICTEAHIYPDSICTSGSGGNDTIWDKSSVSVTGYCDGDSLVCFVIENTGDPVDGDMDGTSEYRVYEDNVLIYTSTFQLTGGETLLLCFPANGKAIRLEADQRPGHPGNSHPKETIELCGDDGNPSLGQILQVPEDDEDEFIEIDCKQVLQSCDPNEKYVKPTGITDNKYISENDMMEYQINFQNTGNDTAFLVIIKDTLSSYLDISTIQLGVGSHPYTFRALYGGVLEFTFENILLPDSNINEPESHGFVKYKVRQQPSNPKGTRIENTAEIYFDYNDAVVTNTVWNIVYDTTFYFNLPAYFKLPEIEFNAWPNPASGNVNISFILPQQGKVLLNVYNSFGKLCNTVFNGLATAGKVYDIDYNTAALPQGIYFVVIKGDNFNKTIKLIVAGK